MPNEPSTLDLPSSAIDRDDRAAGAVPALMIAWSADEPRRVGEVALFDMEGFAQIMGRGDGASGSGFRAEFGPRRPGQKVRARPLQGAGISRNQLRITAHGRRLAIDRLGRCPHVFRGAKVDRCVLAPGDTLLVKGQLLLLCVERPVEAPAPRDYDLALSPRFGEPDALGMLGESAAMWRLRDAVAFHAKAGAHALVLGPSGAGKELVVRAIHALSPRATGPFVARNAATLPASLLEAELFGNVKNYPNPGMQERPGLVGAAEGGTLFLDEIGDLPEALHASLLRLLDGGGEYHRLGEARARRANMRLVGATNRPPDTLKHDLLARLPLRLEVPGLDARRDDIPLLARHLLRRALATTPDLVARFSGPDGEVRVTSDLVDHLLHRPYTTHVRELESTLWRAIAGSAGTSVDRPKDPTTEPPGRDGEPDAPVAIHAEAAGVAPREEPGVDEIRARIADHRGNLVQAARALGLASRYVLYRLVRKHGIDVEAFRGGDG